MRTTKILDSEIKNLKISSLPSRPTAPSSFGGKGYTSKEMKEAFDKLPLLIIERFNMLLDDILDSGDGAISSSINTNLFEGHTLSDFFADLLSGKGAEYISLGDETLEECISRLKSNLEKLNEKINKLSTISLETVISSSSEIVMEHAKIYRLGEMGSLTLSTPKTVHNEYFSELSFDSGTSATLFSSKSEIRFTGDDVSGGIFIPEPNTHYTVFVWYEGVYQGVVRGLSNA